MHSTSKNNKQSAEAETNQQSMTNVDGTYAANDIEADTILFTEHTMPDCELHRSKTNPNCQVVELEDEETGESYMAVVSLREIKAGEFFCVLESESEDNEEDDDSEGEDKDECRPCTT
jgi:U3 small nucleolar RNA-associated protein 6